MFFIPSWQMKTCLDVVRNNPTFDAARVNLRNEYLSIVRAVRSMGIDVCVLIAHHGRCDGDALSKAEELGCDFISLPEFFPGRFSLYPRDILADVGSILYLNDGCFGWVEGERKENFFGTQEVRLSPYGEGGRVLDFRSSERTEIVLVGSLLVTCDSAEDAALDEFAGNVIETGCLPLPMLANVSADGSGPDQFWIKDHLDLAMAPLIGKEGDPHLLVDRRIETVSRSAAGDMEFFGAEDSLAAIGEVCRNKGISMIPAEVAVPFGLNMRQFPDGRVLMSGGDPGLARLIEGIVGDGRVIATDIPVSVYPVFGGGGVGCMMNDISKILA